MTSHELDFLEEFSNLNLDSRLFFDSLSKDYINVITSFFNCEKITDLLILYSIRKNNEIVSNSIDTLYPFFEKLSDKIDQISADNYILKTTKECVEVNVKKLINLDVNIELDDIIEDKKSYKELIIKGYINSLKEKLKPIASQMALDDLEPTNQELEELEESEERLKIS